MSLTRRIAGAAALVVLAGCQPAPGDDPDPSQPSPLRPNWTVAQVPPPPGPPGRVVLRDVAACADRWFAVGAVAGPTGETRPAAWASADARAWTPLTLRAGSPYGAENILYAAACHAGRLAALGAKSGGAHGNPRVSAWRQGPDGQLVEVPSEFEVFGGPEAVNVGRLAGGPSGWAIAGNRVSGAAAWVAPPAADDGFTLRAGIAGLASDAAGRTWANDVVADAGGWLMVGTVTGSGGADPDPVGWTSADGVTWRRVSLPAEPGREDPQRVVLSDGRPLAVGPHGDRFGSWRADGDRWHRGGDFGVRATGGLPAVRSLAASVRWVSALVTDGNRFDVWLSVDAGRSWRPVRPPAELLDGGDRGAALAGLGDILVLAADDGTGSRIWWSRLPDQ